MGVALVAVPGGGPRDRRAVHVGRELGVHVHDQTAPQPGEPAQAARLDQVARAGAHGGRPVVLVPGVLGDPDDLEAPVLRVGALIADALERDADLDLIAPGRNVAARLVHEVGAEIHDAIEPPGADAAASGARVLAFAAHAVLLDSERVHREKQGAAMVVVRVQQDLDVVVGVDVVAVGEGGAHHVPVGFVGADAEVDRVGGVPHERDRGIRRGTAVHGAILREAGEPGGGAPDGLVEHPVDDRCRLEPRRADVELTGVAVVDGAGIARGLQQQEQRGEHGEQDKRGTRKSERGTELAAPYES